MGFFGSLFESESSTTSTTSVYDKRVVGGDGSTSVSADTGGGSLTVVSTDQGAIEAGMTLGTKAIDAATKQAAGTQAAAATLFDGALSSVSAANERLAAAYQNGQAGDQTTLKYAGFIVVGLAAVALLGKMR